MRRKRGWRRVEREFRYLIGAIGFRAIVRATRIVPMGLSRLLFVKLLSPLAWPFAGKYRRKMLDNLDLSYGDALTPQQKERIAKRVLKNMFQGFLETIYSIYSLPRIMSRLRWEGEEHLREAMREGKGVIAVSAHLGNFTLIGGVMRRRGYPCWVIIKDPKHPRMAQVFEEFRRVQGTRSIPADPPMRCQREIMRALRRGEIVLFVSDENQKKGGILIDFMGRRMAMPPGPAFYHLRTGAPILPVFLLREGEDGLRLLIEPPLQVPLQGDKDKDLYSITREVTRKIESFIRRYPDQWHWVSKRRIRTRTRRPSFEESPQR